VAPEKLEGPATALKFLCIEIDDDIEATEGKTRRAEGTDSGRAIEKGMHS